MKKKTLLIVLLIFVATAVLMAAAPAGSLWAAQLEIRNKTHQDVHISLSGGGNFYYLGVAPFTNKTFTVERELYAQKTWACGGSMTGFLDMDTNVRLVFTRCWEEAVNKGEPTIEKVHIDDSVGETENWRYWNWE